MKRWAVLLVSAFMALSLASCAVLPGGGSSQSEEKLEGQEIIESAMRRYNEQTSGGYEAYDNTSDKLIERFVYSYDEVGFLIFLSEVYNEDGSVYKEYNTGYAVYIEEDGKGIKLPKSDERFIVYNNEVSKYTKASDVVFGFIVDGVIRVDKSENDDGSYMYIYVYDPDDAGVQVDGGKLSDYSIGYRVNAVDEVYEFTQKASGTFDSGDRFNYDYTIKLIPSDSVGIIENPITVSETAVSDDSSEEQR